MIQCPKCSAQLPDESKFCLACGEPLSSLSQAPTVAASEGAAPPVPIQSPHVGRIVSSDSVPAGGFTPGIILADRYRIIGLLGRGGMGEVYRADDLKLGQPVALKFLPPALAEDSVRRERFFAEVRITRQLSHPNICRVYDIGEVDGRHFLSMEYIDGEDLASLMKRIGHLSNEKALEIARQIVAGLSVAHERGVLHRDLKPANIMLDGHGRVRITDFGLAIALEDESQAEEIAGTPAYMAPEQLAGKGATVRSDIYSLGLILYEIYTGKKAFTAKTLAELREQKETQTPRAPSELREGIDPVIERVIQRCMEKDPNSRPASVAQLAQALPGGDPLAAAIAAGETPSPEMVAASGSREALQPGVAWGLLVFIIAGTLAILWAFNYGFFSRLKEIPLEKPPEYLVERARQIAKKVGYSGNSADSIYRFRPNNDLTSDIENLFQADGGNNRYSKLVHFIYLQSQTLLQHEWILDPQSIPGLLHPGDVMIVLDTEGRLVSLQAFPIREASFPDTSRPFNWETLFNEAELDFSHWRQADTQWKPLYYADEVTSWFPERAGLPDRIETAAFQGKPFHFEIIYPWTKRQTEISEPSMVRGPEEFVVLFILIASVGVTLFFARRNLRLGRGDRRNAARLTYIVVSAMILIWIFGGFRSSLTLILTPLFGGWSWIFYIAVEPYFRRRWPQIMVSWTRLFSKEWKDPLVGRDILIGCGVGVFSYLFFILFSFLGYYQSDVLRVFTYNLIAISGFHLFVCLILLSLLVSLASSFIWGSILLIMRVILRSDKVAFGAVVLIMTIVISGGNLLSIPIGLCAAGVSLFCLMRFGLLSVGIGVFTIMFWAGLPKFINVSAFYSRHSYAALAIFAAIVLSAFYASLGGRPVFGTAKLDD